MQSYRHAVALGMMLVLSFSLHADCGIERWPVKIAADADAQGISLLAIPASIATLRALPAPRPLPQERRLAPIETARHAVTATLIAYRLAADGGIEMVLADEVGRTIVALIPSVSCVTGSHYAIQIEDARRLFDARFADATDTFRQVRVPVEVQGLGFFDFLRGQYGLAPNGLSLVPVLGLDFTPNVYPTPPPLTSRRRAVQPSRACVAPSLTMTTSRSTNCAGETLTVSWQASSPTSSVSIDGIGTALPPSGSRTLNVTATTAFAGRATNACGTGFESVAVVSLLPSDSATLTAPAYVYKGASATLAISLNGPTRWTISSFLGSAITPQTGTGNAVVRYEASRLGTDTITLVASAGNCNSAVTRTAYIAITTTPPPPPPPPPPPTWIRCCDGTLSPKCTSCSNLSGCCSGHGGVADCGKTCSNSGAQSCSVD